MTAARTAVLVVEDEGLVARDLEHTLGDLGYDVTGTAASAEEALRAASDRVPDLVLMDIRLRGAMDGIEAARLLREQFHVPVVFLTAHVDDKTVARAAETEPYGYVVKPFTPREVRGAIEIAVKKHAGEARRAERERWFSAVLFSLAEAVLACDERLRVTFANPMAERLTGWSEAEARGRPLAEVFRLVTQESERDAVEGVASAMRERAGQTLATEALLLARDGVDKHLVAATAAPIVQGEHLLGAAVVFYDLSEQRRAHERRASAEHVASLRTLVAGLAHEINNPLSYNLANVDYAISELDRKPPRSDPRRIVEALLEAREGAYRVAKIVSEFRKLSRDPGQASGVANVVLSMEWALKVADNKLRHVARIERRLAPVPPVRGTDGRLSQVFMNLLVNAAEAVSGSPDDNVISVASRRDGDHVVVEVRDNGPGIAREDLRRIFDPFFTTKPAGSGMGLSISRGILRAVGGDLLVNSEPGTGTTFRVLLPLAEVDDDAREAAPGADPARRAAQVLVIDDDDLLRGALSRMLEGHHTVETVGSAREALALLGQRRDFDVILCDVMMPEMNGAELYEALARMEPALATRVVFMTGGSFTEKADSFLEGTPCPRLDKPLSKQSVLEAITRVLESSGPPTG